LGVRFGGTLGGAIAMASLETGLAFDEFMRMTHEGQKMDPQVAAEAAQLVGVINGGLEFMSFGFMKKLFVDPLRSLRKDAVRRLVERHIGRGKVKRFMAETGARIGATTLGESVTEASQEASLLLVGDDLRAEVFGEPDHGVLDVLGSEQAVDQMLGAAGEAFLATTTLGLAGSFGVHAPYRAYQERSSQATKRSLDRQEELKAAIPVAQRDPETMQVLLQAFPDGGPVYISAKVLMEYAIANVKFQSEVLAKIPGISLNDVSKAAKRGQDLAIDRKSWFQYLNGTDHHAALSPHARDNINAPSAAELSEEEAARMDELKILAEQLAEVAEGDEEFETNRRDLAEKLKVQIKDAGRFRDRDLDSYAFTLASMITVAAKREGIEIDDFLGRLRIIGPEESLNAGQVLSQDETDVGGVGSEGFLGFFGDWINGADDASKTVTEDGTPERYLHGSTHDIESFSTDRANPENQWGARVHLTNSAEDASENYAGEGPDLTARIEFLAEDLVANDETGNLGEDEAMAMARAELVGEAGPNVGAYYVSIRNPVQVGGPNETVFMNDGPVFDEDGDIIDETEAAPGSLNALLEAIQEVFNTREVISGDITQLLADVLEAADYSEISASRLDTTMRESAGLIYAMNEEGSMIAGDVIADVFEAMGFDGIIDQTVNTKFGAASGRRNAMVGVDEFTKHAIPFNKEQIKSVNNRGTFSPTDARVLYQPGQQIIAAPLYSKMLKVLESSEELTNQLKHSKKEPPHERIKIAKWREVLGRKAGARKTNLFKPIEYELSGLDIFFDEKLKQAKRGENDGKLSRQEIIDFLNDHQFEVTVVQKGGQQGIEFERLQGGEVVDDSGESIQQAKTRVEDLAWTQETNLNDPHEGMDERTADNLDFIRENMADQYLDDAGNFDVEAAEEAAAKQALEEADEQIIWERTERNTGWSVQGNDLNGYELINPDGAYELGLGGDMHDAISEAEQHLVDVGEALSDDSAAEKISPDDPNQQLDEDDRPLFAGDYTLSGPRSGEVELLVTIPTEVLGLEPMPDTTGWTVTRTPDDRSNIKMINITVKNAADEVIFETNALLGSEQLKMSDAEIIQERAEVQQVRDRPSNVFTKRSHFPDNNIVVHVRMDLREGMHDGKTYAFITEVQSDWNQDARKRIKRYVKALISDLGMEKEEALKTVSPYQVYRNERRTRADLDNFAEVERFTWVENDLPGMKGALVSQGRVFEELVAHPNPDGTFRIRGGGDFTPDNPFKDTDQWATLGLKHALAYAVEHGADAIAWATGDQQVDEIYPELADVLRNAAWETVTVSEEQVRLPGAVAGDVRVGVPKAGEYRKFTVRTTRGSTFTSYARATDGFIVNSNNTDFIGNYTFDVAGDAFHARVLSEKEGSLSSEDVKDIDVGTRKGMIGFYDKSFRDDARKYTKRIGGTGRARKAVIPRSIEGSLARRRAADVRQTMEAEVEASKQRDYIGPSYTLAELEELQRTNEADPAVRDLRKVADAMGRGTEFDEVMKNFGAPESDMDGLARLLGGRYEFAPQSTELEMDESKLDDSHVVHAIDITDEMRELVKEGQELHQGQRGRIALDADPQGRMDVVIQLLQAHDLSTLLHESGHFFLDMLQRLASREGASAQIQEDMTSIRRWYARTAQPMLTWVKTNEADLRKRFGDLAVDSVLAGGTDMIEQFALEGPLSQTFGEGGVIATAMHEQWAEAFETYLSSGRAPSKALKRAFQQFWSWLLAVYGEIRAENRPMDPEVTRIMDRYLATDRELTEIGREMSYEPLGLDMDADDTAK
jgi:hypothetical protein